MDTLISKDLIEQITADKLDAIIAKETYTIIDVRDQKSIELQGNIPNAINIPFDEINEAVDCNHEHYNTVFSKKGSFLFCCTGGVMSYTAAIKAKRNGINKVLNLDGGHSSWLKYKKAMAN